MGIQGLNFDVIKSNFDEDLEKSLFSGADGKDVRTFAMPLHGHAVSLMASFK